MKGNWATLNDADALRLGVRDGKRVFNGTPAAIEPLD